MRSSALILNTLPPCTPLNAHVIYVSSGKPSSTSPGCTSTVTCRTSDGRHLYIHPLSADIWFRSSLEWGSYGPWPCGTTTISSPENPWSVLTSSTHPPLHPPDAPSFVGLTVVLVGSPMSLSVPPHRSLAQISVSLSAFPPTAMSLP